MTGLRLESRKAIAVAVALLCMPGSALAETAPGRAAASTTQAEQTEARERYTRAMQIFSEGRYDVALIEMQRAYSLNPSYRILYNLAQIQVHLGDAAAALGNFERYLSEGGTDIPAPRLAEVNQEIAKLRPRVATIELVVKEAGAEVLLDDGVVGQSPYRKSILVNAGRHKLSAAKPGMAPVTRMISVAGADTLTLELDLSVAGTTGASNADSATPGAGRGATVPAVATDRPTGQDAPPHKPRSIPWTGWAITGALAAGTVVAGVLTQSEASSLADLRERPGATRQELDDAASAAQRNAIITDILLGSTVVAGAVSLYFTLTPRSSSASHGRSAEQFGVGAVPGRLFLRGSF